MNSVHEFLQGPEVKCACSSGEESILLYIPGRQFGEFPSSACMLAPRVPRPFLCGRGERGEGRKGLVNNSTPTRIHGCIPAVSVDEGKHECQVGVSRE